MRFGIAANPCYLTCCVIIHFYVLMTAKRFVIFLNNLYRCIFSASFLHRNQPARNNEPPSPANHSNAPPVIHRHPTIIAPPTSDVLDETASNISSNRILNPSSTMREPANRHLSPRPPAIFPKDFLSENYNLPSLLSCWNCGHINFY